MKKIGIISQLTMSTLNYGNRLQAYALNTYITKNFECEATSLIIGFLKRKSTLKIPLRSLFKKMFFSLNGKNSPSIAFSGVNLKSRLENFQKFTNRIKTQKFLDFGSLQKADFDVLIVGSDVVWSQSRTSVDEIVFLNFEQKKTFEKVSYAASFGSNWIPWQNKSYIRKCLSDFNAISVREKSSVELLKSIGVENVVHVCDPTLLLTAEEWSSVAEPVEEVAEKYIFVYLLGKDAEQRKAITDLASKHNLKIVTISNAGAFLDFADNEFGDYKLIDASPENWIWLIKNAEYVITDSFHGTVFSTIFSKKFIVVKRFLEENINIRMTDFLDTIGEQDKFVDITNVNSLDDFVWDYEKIHKTTGEFIAKSKEYLNNALIE